MPPHNHFRHQSYSSTPPAAPYSLITPDASPTPGESSGPRGDGCERDVLRRTGVAAIYLMHGTLAGTDAFGWIGELERAWPRIGASLRRQHKRVVDAFVGDHGNYVEAFRKTCDQLANGPAPESTAPDKPRIPVRLFHWSSQNHHLGRAEAAVMLIDELVEQDWPAGSRIALWGHSHAGNVLALVTNLLAAGRLTRAAFLQAIRPYAKGATGGPQHEAWRRIENVLREGSNPLKHVSLDIATFGTPVRYGWDTLGYDNLVHFVNHAPQPGMDEYRAKYPQTVDEYREAIAGNYGDYIQQTFVAGTNIPPLVTNWNAWTSDRMLSRLLQRNQSRADLLKRLEVGKRVADEGETLLVNYQQADPEGARVLAGHAVYTRVDWLPFHIAQFVKRCYSEKSTNSTARSA